MNGQNRPLIKPKRRLVSVYYGVAEVKYKSSSNGIGRKEWMLGSDLSINYVEGVLGIPWLLADSGVSIVTG